MTFILSLAGRPALSGTAEACHACADHFDLVRRVVTHDGTTIVTLHDGVTIDRWDGEIDLPPRLAREGLMLNDGSPIPPLCDLDGSQESNVLAFDEETADVVARRPRRRRLPKPEVPRRSRMFA